SPAAGPVDPLKGRVRPGRREAARAGVVLGLIEGNHEEAVPLEGGGAEDSGDPAAQELLDPSKTPLLARVRADGVVSVVTEVRGDEGEIGSLVRIAQVESQPGQGNDVAPAAHRARGDRAKVGEG